MIFFFFNDTATTEIYTLSLHDALPIFPAGFPTALRSRHQERLPARVPALARRSEEHTSELQSQFHLVCRLLLEKKNKIYSSNMIIPYSICSQLSMASTPSMNL